MIELRRDMGTHVRTYAMTAASDLFGGHVLTVTHGRLGWHARRRDERFNSYGELAARARVLLKRRRRHRYIVVQGTAESLTETR